MNAPAVVSSPNVGTSPDPFPLDNGTQSRRPSHPQALAAARAAVESGQASEVEFCDLELFGWRECENWPGRFTAAPWLHGCPPYLRNATISAMPPRKAPEKEEFGIVVDKCDYDACLEIKGNVFEFSKFAKPVRVGGPKTEATANASENPDLPEGEESGSGREKKELTDEEKQERSRKESNRRKRSKIATLTNINFHSAPAFLTLTFRDEIEPKDAIRELSKFLRRLGAKNPGLKYLWILELQKSGRPHFHLLVEGIDSEVFEKQWYVKTKKRAKVFQLLQKNGEMGRDFGQIQFFENKTAAKDFAKANGRAVAYSSSLVNTWKQGFVHIRELKDKHGDMLSDVGAYITKYMTKEAYTEELEGVTGYSFSRGKLRQRGPRLLNSAASKMFEWFRQNIAEWVKHVKSYDGENEYLGQWQKVFLSVSRDFVQDFLPDVDDWFTMARDTWGYDGVVSVSHQSKMNFHGMGITNQVLCGVAS